MKHLIPLLLLITLVLSQNCPVDCGQNGECKLGYCKCVEPFEGIDCSIWRQVIRPGVQVTSQIGRFEWRFWNFTLNAGEAFVLNVQQVEEANDIDVYIGKNNFPTFQDHFDEDVSTDAQFSLSLDQPVTQTTRFYIGVFGFTGTTHFNMNLQVTSGCPNGCSGNGRCQRGSCICNPGYSGESCSESTNSIQLNRQYSGIVVPEGEWLFYSYDLTTVQNMKLHVTQASGDVDIYVQFGRVPSFFDYRYVDTTLDEDITVNIAEPEVGTWYFGFYGYAESTFSFKLSRDSGCPDRCSGHGTCQGSTCVCNDGYTGRACETRRNNIINGQSVSGFVSENGWNFYHFVSDTANSFVISLTQESEEMDCDIYVNRGQNPTLAEYLFSDITTGNTVNLRIDDAGSATWYIGIFGYEQCQYTMTVSESSSCPGGCGDHGTCNDAGRCICNNGWVGQNCETQSNVIQNGGTLTGQTVESNEWKYYSITVEHTSQLNIVVKEKSTVGMVWLFVSAGQYPTLADHEEDDTETSESVHRISLEFGTPKTGVQYFIGVYGSPFALRPVEFDISVWYPPF